VDPRPREFPRVAIVHDWLNQLGGAEAVLETLVAMFPGSPVFTTLYWRAGMPPHYRDWDIRCTWLDRAPGIYRHHQVYLPLYPLAVRSMDVRGYPVVISNKSGFCHGVRTTRDQVHIDYCLTPTRYVWDYAGYVQREGLGTAARLALWPVIRWLRRWDRRAADGVDHFVAISAEVRARIRRFYGRDAHIIHPPVHTERYRPSGEAPGDYYLVVSRLIPYKRIDLAVQACGALRRRLVVVGDGRDRAALERLAGPTVQFTGRLPDAEVAALMAGCRAFLFPGCEDFGIAPVEAQAAGRPVIAFGGGGALDTVVDGETGVLFPEQSVEALIAAIQRLEARDWDAARIHRHAQQFSVARFERELRAFIAERVGSGRSSD
jgi:glycosyltransferase involved in cell wall biosynthesis